MERKYGIIIVPVMIVAVVFISGCINQEPVNKKCDPMLRSNMMTVEQEGLSKALSNLTNCSNVKVATYNLQTSLDYFSCYCENNSYDENVCGNLDVVNKTIQGMQNDYIRCYGGV